MFALLLMQAAMAGDGEAPRWRDPPACWDGSQSELTHCAWTEYREADAAMNRQWEKTAKILKRYDVESPPDATRRESSLFKALLAGQRAWLKYRDEHCRVFGAGGGSMSPMLEGICLRDITRKRTEELAELASSPATGKPYFEDQ